MEATETSEDAADSATYKRPGVVGIDYDHYGEEMAPNARIWRAYVEQTDKIDKEVVDGWNNFVLESSKDLKPDPAETSARTLSLISQTLLAMSNNSINTPIVADPDDTEFVAETSAVVVNALWFMSLSLSVAVTLIAILAKEWCDGFISGRIGPMLKQGRIRQQRWDGIERWKMREILYMLPLPMHAALLLFAIGLSLYLWNIDTRVAFPVVVTSVLAVLFYSVTVMLPLFSRFCPFTTTLAKLISQIIMAILRNPLGKKVIVDIAVSQRWISWRITYYKKWPIRWLRRSARYKATDIENGLADGNKIPALASLRITCMETMNIWVGQFQQLLTDRTQLLDSQVPMDNITSSMLAWMITNCEDPKSVDLASQAISGADLQLPREPLWKCNAIQLVRQRLEYCLHTLELGSAGPERDRLLEETSLYSRSFTFLTSHIPVDLHAEGLPEPGAVPRMPMHYWSIAEDSNRAPYYGVADGFGCVVRPFSILAYSLRSPIRHDVAAFELNNFPLDLGNTHWKGFNHSRKQHANQWELLGHINSEQLKLSPSAIRALVNGIAKSYLYKLPELGFHSPIALVNLLHTTKPLGIHEEELSMDQQERKTKLRLTIGMALAVIHFAKKDAPGLGDSDTTWDAHLLQAKGVHDTLAKSKLGSHDVELLLLFGLLGLLGKPETSGSSPRLTLDEVESIGRALNGLGVREWLIEPSNAPLPLPDSAPSHPLELGEYWAIMASDWLDAAYPPSGSALEPQSRTFSTSCLNAVLCTGLCSTFPKFIIPPLVNRFRLSRSPELKRRCVVALISALPPDSGGLARVVFKDQFMESDFADQLILFLDSEPGDGQMQLLGFHFIWIVANSITADGGDQAETALLSKLFKSPVSLSENRIHRNQHGMSLIDIWRERLEGICASDPRFVLDSRILREVRSVYDSNPGIRPYPAKPSDGERSWDTILEELEMDCRKRLAAQVDTEASRLVAKGPEKEQSDSVGGV